MAIPIGSILGEVLLELRFAGFPLLRSVSSFEFAGAASVLIARTRPRTSDTV